MRSSAHWDWIAIAEKDIVITTIIAAIAGMIVIAEKKNKKRINTESSYTVSEKNAKKIVFFIIKDLPISENGVIFVCAVL